MIWVIIITCIIPLVLCDQSPNARRKILFAFCGIFTIVVGLRSNEWNDTLNYWHSFINYTQPIWNLSWTRTDHFIKDKGFLFICAVIKTISSDRFIFFASVACITNYFLYKDLLKYSLFPIAGFFIYIGRFALGRNFMQIRAALAILIVIYAIQFASNRNFRKYLLCIIIASTIHLSMICALPFYWLNKLNLHTKKIIIYTIIALFITYLYSFYIKGFATLISLKYEVATAYTSEQSEYTPGKGLANPMIYFQIIILWIYSLFEKKLHNITPYYSVIRNGYFYSTLILILLSSFGVLCSRLSTIFSTLEIFILPNLCAVVNPRYQYFARLLVSLLGLTLFYISFNTFAFSHPSFHNPLIN